jgi:hypothetical protein
MITQKLGSGLTLLLLSTTACWAAATQEEADSIKGSIQTYIGKEEGAVTVTPAGDGYDISFDAMVYLSKVKEPGFTASFKPFVYHAVPKGDGLWQVDAKNNIDISFGNPANLTVDIKVPDTNFSGTFSEAITGFLESKTTTGDMTVLENIVDANAGVTTNVAFAIKSLTSITKAVPAADGTADTSMEMSYQGVTASSSTVAGQGGQPVNLTYAMPTMTYKTATTGISNRKILDVMAWFVAHPTREDMIRDQSDLKLKLKAALPVAKNLKGNMGMEGLSVTSPIGVVTFDSFGFGADMNGVVKEGRLGESFSFAGLKLPPGVAPPWSEGLIPSNLKFAFEISGFDAEAPAAMFIDQLDVSAPEPVRPGTEQLYLAAFAPKNTITLTIPAGEITSPVYSLTYEGTSTISFAGLPQVNAKFRMTGMDKVIAQLQQAATDPTAQQGMAMLFAAKGIGKADGDAITWDVTMSPEGKLLVNGTDLSSMMGAIAPPPPQQ